MSVLMKRHVGDDRAREQSRANDLARRRHVRRTAQTVATRGRRDTTATTAREFDHCAVHGYNDEST